MRKIITLLLLALMSTYVFSQGAYNETIKRMPTKTSLMGGSVNVYPPQILRSADTNVMFQLNHALTPFQSIQTAIDSGWISKVIGDEGTTNLFEYRKLNNHDSLSQLDEKNYASLTDKPDLNLKLNISDSTIKYVTPHQLNLIPTATLNNVLIAGDTASYVAKFGMGVRMYNTTPADTIWDGDDWWLDTPPSPLYIKSTLNEQSGIYVDNSGDDSYGIKAISQSNGIYTESYNGNKGVDSYVYGQYGIAVQAVTSDNYTKGFNAAVGGYGSVGLNIYASDYNCIPIVNTTEICDTFMINKTNKISEGFITKQVFLGNGAIIAPSLTIAQINTLGGKTFTTKEYVDSKILDSVAIFKRNTSSLFSFNSGSNNSTYSNCIGDNAGNGADNTNNSNFIGKYAGYGAILSEYSNYIGANAGKNSANSYNSNFIGYWAGGNSDNTINSNFIGNSAGYGSNSSYSNFVGQDAGNGATNSSYSILLGFQVGKTYTLNNIGQNNIIIGKNISLPNATANAINLGGVIYAINTYSTPSGSPSITPTTTGKVGIGIVTPTERLEVNGNIKCDTLKYNYITGLKTIQLDSILLIQANWTLVSGIYEYTLSNANITTTKIVDAIPFNSAIDIVRLAEFYPKTLTASGSVKFYSKYQPIIDIYLTLNISE